MNFNRIAGQEGATAATPSQPSSDPRASSSNIEPMSDPYEEAAERRHQQEDPELENA
jgi:hypothetical protein